MFSWISSALFPKSPEVLDRENKLAIHRKRVEWVYGCIACGTELLPPEKRWLCGTCKETFSYCERCYTPDRHGHAMFLEQLYWEVDPIAISSATSIAEVVRLVFGTVYTDRPCLGIRNG